MNLNKESKDFITTGKGEFKLWFDEENNIIKIIVIGYVDEELAEKIIKQEGEMLERYEKNNVLADLTKTEKASSKARKILAEVAKRVGERKIALISKSLFVKVGADFMIKLGGLKNSKFFNNEKEALKWLKEK